MRRPWSPVGRLTGMCEESETDDCGLQEVLNHM
jgi:hypothetical protein